MYFACENNYFKAFWIANMNGNPSVMKMKFLIYFYLFGIVINSIAIKTIRIEIYSIWSSRCPPKYSLLIYTPPPWYLRSLKIKMSWNKHNFQVNVNYPFKRSISVKLWVDNQFVRSTPFDISISYSEFL